MAVGAEESQILDVVVPPVPIDVIHFEWERAALPYGVGVAESTTVGDPAFQHDSFEAIAVFTASADRVLQDQELLGRPVTSLLPRSVDTAAWREMRGVDAECSDPPTDVGVMASHGLQAEIS
ncbi:hypothetical protein FHS38_000068 [Streptomyces netropsis]|uniref:Uncharacterized protein n=1 Tax=Streptomyces netropsis TaxID=55404 RepID=A0A7W7PBK1_STRNE|nr:hypothetical protein [Streptomyces netropsis]GGR06385.1 hypothetical protein GCM10010219_08580 [Streptomyces netropsis]